MKTRSRSAIIVSIAAVVVGCATAAVDLPSITDSPTGRRVAGKIVWHELLTHTPEESRRFYGELFGWEFETAGSTGYTLIRHQGRPIGGMIDTIALNGRDDISQWVTVISVADVEAAARRFAEEGGEVLTPPTDLARRGRMAVVADPEGALLALLETREGDPADRPPAVGAFLWDELWSADVDGAARFYTAIVDYRVEALSTRGDGDRNYRVLAAGGAPRAGILRKPIDTLEPVWVNYLRVEDPAAVTARAAELGGRVIVDATDRPIGGQAAFIAGPSGAGIALQTWPLRGN